ncbi:MAG: DNA topoisomerase 4 subunit A [Alphaproteobacteria bacterium MarineAlpha11_Bin1]|nr:MAG: DNA topoisomerase 4 subunit A [Alphaproteobacteria bacterium MarineAlpha11_Bin1]|tara:strand:+ start:8040 stop:10271 length:2232 start_codon:yes stop_codon:yes gene_type:complete
MADQTIASKVEEVAFGEALGERYLAYALSTITSRSLPDVRDGMKPVHRRLMFAMRQLRLEPEAGFKKCARVVGDVIGKYHPHGDIAVYDTLVRLAQDFAVRYPLVEGQGNFGNIDGDNAAAMRYTESRLTEYAIAMLEGIDDDAVDFRENYDGSEQEPMLLPASVPNLLCNGAAGIAVGMATSIPPHNLDEVCAALLHLLKFPNASIAKLVELIPGPDFPTGGVLVEARDSVAETYKTGRGSFRLRARWGVEKLSRGQYQIVISEIPYQVQKGRIVEKIAEFLNAKKLPLLGDIRDESAEDIRLILEPRNRSIEPNLLMDQMFRHTDLETRIGLNMNVLDSQTFPSVMNLRGVLQSFLEHRETVLVRRTKHRLSKIKHRMEVLEGYLVAYLNIDEVIRIIREEDEPKVAMMKKWGVSDVQAEAILNMRLRTLRRLEEISINQEHKTLSVEKEELNDLLKSKKKREAEISGQIKEIRTKFGRKTDLGVRRTEIGEAPKEMVVPLDILIEREPITVICSQKGWIRGAKGHLTETADLKYKDGDGQRFVFHAQTTDKILMFATNGRFYTLFGDKLPGGRGHGDPVRLMVDLPNDQDILALFVHSPGQKIVVASSDGRGFIAREEELIAQTKNGKQVLNIETGKEAQACAPVTGDMIAVVGENRKIVIFPLEELPEMTRGRGVKLQSYKSGGLADLTTFYLKDGLPWRTKAGIRIETDIKPYIGKRAQAGRMAMRGFPRNNRFGNYG